MKDRTIKDREEQAQVLSINTEEERLSLLSGVSPTIFEESDKEWEKRVRTADSVQTHAFQMNRYLSRNKGVAEQSLFDTLREQEDDTKQSGLLIKTPPRGVSLLSLKRMNVALAKRLYNTSYREHNTKLNTGLIKDGISSSGDYIPPLKVEWTKKDKDGNNVKDSKGNNIIEKSKYYSYSEIEFSLTALTADFFGLSKGQKPTNGQKKIVKETLEAMQVGTTMILPNGDEYTKSLLWIQKRYRRKIDNAMFYNVLLTPLYAMEIEQGSAAHPQDISQRMALIEKQTSAHWDLLGLLGEQMGGTFTIHKDKLLERLGMWEDYQKDKKRANRKLSTLFEDMKSKGAGKLLDSAPDGGANPKETIGADGGTMYIFYFNPDYIPKGKN